jgi:hypothetical protein
LAKAAAGDGDLKKGPVIGVIHERGGYYAAPEVFMQISPAAEHS